MDSLWSFDSKQFYCFTLQTQTLFECGTVRRCTLKISSAELGQGLCDLCIFFRNRLRTNKQTYIPWRRSPQGTSVPRGISLSGRLERCCDAPKTLSGGELTLRIQKTAQICRRSCFCTYACRTTKLWHFQRINLFNLRTLIKSVFGEKFPFVSQ